MKFKKEKFAIQLNENIKDVAVVEGYIEETNTYGFYKHNKVWKATDLLSGSLVCCCPTRKECVAWIEENLDRIAAIKETQKYKLKVESFRELLKEALNA